MKILGLLEKICGISDEERTRMEKEGYEFIRRTRVGDFYRKGNCYILYNPKEDKIIRQFRTE